jgi:hypothetical protein
MAFGGMEIGAVTRSQDYSIIKQNEDNKAFTDQVNIGQQVDKQTEKLTKEVHSSDNSDWHEQKPDAKEKGNNEYRGDGGRHRPKQEKSEQVIIKGRQSFDMKV